MKTSRPGVFRSFTTSAVAIAIWVHGQPLSSQADPENKLFIRADADADGILTLGDAVVLLHQLFVGRQVTCADASDADDNGEFELADCVFVLSHLFLGGPKPPRPYPGCGGDRTPDDLTCVQFRRCDSFHSLLNTVGMTMVFIPPGEFFMGSPMTERNRNKGDLGEATSFDDEAIHHVLLTCGFYMATTEVTQAQYEQLMHENPSLNRGSVVTKSLLPVESVTWSKAVEFCRRLTQEEGMQFESLEYRLPTEAEWEYCCRAGTTTRFWFGEALDCRDDLDFQAYCPELVPYSLYSVSNQAPPTRPIAQGIPNPWGLYDMPGNASEWCSDWYAAYPNEDVTDPAGPTTGERKVLRGHSIVANSRGRSAARSGMLWRDTGSPIGFRVVLSACRPVPITPE